MIIGGPRLQEHVPRFGGGVHQLPVSPTGGRPWALGLPHLTTPPPGYSFLTVSGGFQWINSRRKANLNDFHAPKTANTVIHTLKQNGGT